MAWGGATLGVSLHFKDEPFERAENQPWLAAVFLFSYLVAAMPAMDSFQQKDTGKEIGSVVERE